LAQGSRTQPNAVPHLTPFSATMAITESSVHKNLNRDRLFEEAWWLNYCFCCGRAVGGIGDPFFGSEVRELCIHGTCLMTDIGDPLCSSVDVMCCFMRQGSFPAAAGSPTCVCCNKKLAGGDTGSWKAPLFDWTGNFDQTFWLYYFLCVGAGLSAPGADSRPLYAMQGKMCCIKQGAKLSAPIQDGVMCTGISTSFCCWEHLQFPPAPGNPGFKCCGFPKKPGQKDSVKPMSYGAPGQVEMS